MEKINFEDGTLVSNAKVTIDNVEHEVTPAEYSGNTPLSAYTLNLMQSNIEEQLKTKQTTQIAEELSIPNTAPVNGSLDIKDGKTIQEGTPTPDTPIVLRNVGDNINIFDKDNANIVRLLATSNVFTTSDKATCIYIPIKSNTLYTVTKNIYINTDFFIVTSEQVPANGVSYTNKVSTTLSDTSKSLTIQSGTNDKYLFVYVKWGLTDCESILNALKIEKGSTPTPYTPYNCGSIDIKVKNEDNTQNKIIQFPLAEGQVIHKGDYLAEDGIHQKRYTYTITGQENGIYISNPLTNVIRGVIPTTAPTRKGNAQGICSHFSYEADYDIDKEHIYIYTNSYIYLFIDKTKVSTLEELKTYLAEQYANGTPLKIEYELETEVVTPYTEEQQEAYYQLQHLLMYEGYTNIECIDEIKPDIQVTYLYNNEINKSFGSRIDKLEDEVYELKKQVADLTAMVLLT